MVENKARGDRGEDLAKNEIRELIKGNHHEIVFKILIFVLI